MKSIKVADDVHEGLKIMAALERRGLTELINEVLGKLVAPYRGIKFHKKTTLTKPNK